MQDTEEVTTALIIEQWREGKASGTPAPLDLIKTRIDARRRLSERREHQAAFTN